MRWGGEAAALCLLLPVAAVAQEPWRASYFPYVVGSPTDGVMGIARYQLVRNAPYFIEKTDERDLANPLSFAGALSVEAGIGTRGSRFGSVLFRGPGLIDGWRFHGTLEARREGRFGFHGLGPPGEQPSDPPPPGAEDYNRVHRTRYVARAEVTRRIAGPLRVAVAGSVEHTEFTPLTGTTLFGPTAVSGTDAILRATVVLDIRDLEFVPGNGVLAEASAYVGTDGIDTGVQDGSRRASYTGVAVHLRGYVSPREGTVVAARAGLRRLSAGAPLSARFMLPGWERDLTVLGGWESHRPFVRGRFAGRGVLLGALELRHDLLNAGDLGAVTALGFLDGGRVFEREDLTLTTRGWDWGYGGGLALRILRSAVLTFNFAGGGDGFTFSTGMGWSY